MKQSVFIFILGILPKLSIATEQSNTSVALSTDDEFNFKLLVTLSQAIYGGADVNDMLQIGGNIVPSDFSSWNNSFYQLATKTESEARKLEEQGELNVRDTYFSASNYWRNVDYYLHGNWDNPWINETWVYQKENYDKAIAQLPVPGERLTLPAKGFDVYAVYYGVDPVENITAPQECQKRPTLILGNGYDGSQEDIFFALGVPALERGYNVITYEGPGQPSVRRNQSIGFIKDWNRAVSPVIDYLQTRKDVDTDRIVLVGFSFSGFLAEQAAAVENDRLAALVLDPGVSDVYAAFTAQLPADLKALFDSGRRDEFDQEIHAVLANSSTPTQLRWGVEQGLWSFMIQSPYDFLQHVRGWNSINSTAKITIPTWIANGDNEQFYPGQSMKVASELRQNGAEVTVKNYTGTAGNHCQAGAYQTLARDLFSWLKESIGDVE